MNDLLQQEDARQCYTASQIRPEQEVNQRPRLPQPHGEYPRSLVEGVILAPHPERGPVSLPSLRDLFPKRLFTLPTPSELTNVRGRINNLTLPPLRLGTTLSEQDNGGDLDNNLTLHVSEQNESAFPEPSQTRNSASPRYVIKNSASASAKQLLLAPQPGQNKRFICPQCRKKFTANSQLTRHKNGIHNKKRIFTCTFPECTYSSDRKYNVTHHEKVHVPLADRGASCPFLGLETCGFVTKAADPSVAISNHMKRSHSQALVERFARMRKGEKDPGS